MEELEAVDWYNQRVAACKDKELRAILAHNRDEEKEILSAVFGLMLGVLNHEISGLFAVVKSMGIFLYAPAIISMFPQLPQWIAKLFPTYYIIGPVMDVTQRDAGWSVIWWQVIVLVGLIAALGAATGFLAGRNQESLA
jgi:ABC-2 type transport system permease protein